MDPRGRSNVAQSPGEVMERLSSFVDPTGRKPVKAIYRREEIFKGQHADTALDILMEPAETYSLTHAKSAIEDADWVSGDPRGVIVAAGPGVKAFEQPPLLIDMAPTILAARRAGLDRALGSRLARDCGFRGQGRAEAADPRHADRDESPSVSDTEADEMEEHLRGLGYLE